MEEILIHAVDYAIQKGAEYAEARFQKDVSNSIVLKNGVVETVSSSSITGVGIRILLNGSLAFASTNNWRERNSVEKVINLAIKMARGRKSSGIKFSREKTIIANIEIKPKKDPNNFPLDEKLLILKEADKALSSEKAKFPNRVILYSEMSTEKVFVNSEGSVIRQVIPRIYLYTFFAVIKNGRSDTRFIELGASRGIEALDEWNLLEKFKKEAEIMAEILEAPKAPEGVMDVVLGPEVSGIAVHESVGHPFEADRILGREGAQAGESFVDPEMLGKKVGNDVFTVIDDPTIPGSYGFYLYDDEGVPARPRYLIFKGTVNEFLHNRETGSIFGTGSNGSARASRFDREPIVRMANTYIAPGDMSFEELIEDIKFGVYIKTFGEWNIDDLRYNMRYIGKEAWLIENGELKHLVRNPVLEITTPKLYESIDAVDKNLEFFAGTCGKGDPAQGIPVYLGGPNVRLRKVYIYSG